MYNYGPIIKPLDESTFSRLISELGMFNYS